MNLVIVIFIIIILIGLTFLAIIAKLKRKISIQDRTYIRHKWKEINRENTNQPEKIIFEADKLIDYALHKLGHQGTLGEKLKSAKARFSDINGLWFAHKLRNKIAHEIDFNLKDDEARKAIKQFEKALKDLKCL